MPKFVKRREPTAPFSLPQPLILAPSIGDEVTASGLIISDTKIGFEACVEFLKGLRLPNDWAEPFAQRLTSDPPRGFSPTRWYDAQDAAWRFAREWAFQAYLLSWNGEDVFGLNPHHPAEVEGRGLAFLLGDGSEVVEIDRDGANYITPRGGRRRFTRPSLMRRGS